MMGETQHAQALPAIGEPCVPREIKSLTKDDLIAGIEKMLRRGALSPGETLRLLQWSLARITALETVIADVTRAVHALDEP